MSIFTRNKFLIFIILLLVATNVSTLITVWHKTGDNSTLQISNANDNIEQPRINRGRHFRDELNLSPKQFRQFRQFRQQYHPIVHELKTQMDTKRVDLLNELSLEQPDTLVLNQISKDIGEMHTLMKMATNNYFINMKSVCTPEQQVKLVDVFKAMLNTQNNMGMPNQGRQSRSHRSSRNSNNIKQNNN